MDFLEELQASGRNLASLEMTQDVAAVYQAQQQVQGSDTPDAPLPSQTQAIVQGTWSLVLLSLKFTLKHIGIMCLMICHRILFDNSLSNYQLHYI